MLTIADAGGRGFQETLILADVICEQPLIYLHTFVVVCQHTFVFACQHTNTKDITG